TLPVASTAYAPLASGGLATRPGPSSMSPLLALGISDTIMRHAENCLLLGPKLLVTMRNESASPFIPASTTPGGC
ncbi:5851_t:CDS:2, partial [Acaulospora colombiana]